MMPLKRVEDWVPVLREMKLLGALLIERQKITKEQLAAALGIQRENKAKGKKDYIGKILVETGSIHESDLLSLFSEQLGIPYMQNLSLKSLEDMGEEITRETYEFLYKLCPLKSLETEEYLPYRSSITSLADDKKEWNVYCFAHDPWQYVDILLRFDRILTSFTPLGNDSLGGVETDNPLAGVSKVNFYIKLAKRGDILRVIEDLKEYSYTRAKASVETYSTVRLFRDMVEFGIQTKCSDIHISPNNSNGGLNVRFRRDGDLAPESKFCYGSEKFPLSSYEEFSNVIFDDAGMDRNTKNISAHDGAIQHSADGTTYDMRIASVPILLGQKQISTKLTIRILYKGGTRDINRIGMLPEQLETVKQLYAKSEGLTLLTGPTSSGKTTTIYSILNSLNLKNQACYTIENPVEYELPNAEQIQVDEKSGLGFSEILRNMLRQDPDIVFVGEMRDKESAESVIHIANTGHTVFSTIHANSAYKVPQRLMNMGIAPHQIFSSLNLVISQRLAHRNCTACSAEYRPTEFEMKLLGLDSNKDYKHGLGVLDGETCPRCEGKGYIGRMGIFEILPTAMYPEWERHADTPEELKSFFTSLRDDAGNVLYPDLMGDARMKMERGLISPKALASIFSRLEIRG